MTTNFQTSTHKVGSSEWLASGDRIRNKKTGRLGTFRGYAYYNGYGRIKYDDAKQPAEISLKSIELANARTERRGTATLENQKPL